MGRGEYRGQAACGRRPARYGLFIPARIQDTSSRKGPACSSAIKNPRVRSVEGSNGGASGTVVPRR